MARSGGALAEDEVAAALGVGHGALAEAVGRLLADGLLRVVPDDGPGRRRFAVVDPDVAAAALISPLDRDIDRLRAEATRIRERVDGYRRDYVTSLRAPGSVVHEARGDTEVTGLLALVTSRCVDDALVLRTGRLESLDLDALCAPLLARRVRVRIACLHRSRTEFALRHRLRRLCDAGADVRTVSRVPTSALVVDGSVVVLLDEVEGVPVATSVHAVPQVVAFLLDSFGDLWDAGRPLEGTDAGRSTDVARDLQRSILELMAQGATDEVIARKLGMSVRSCRRHIASVFAELGAVSRFQAGLAAGHRRLVAVP
ncbi:MAG: LuxR C-terminal-related transcriptional regulator [Kineosporiaceae bacterium]